MTTPRIDELDKNFLINGGYDYSQRIGNALTNSIKELFRDIDAEIELCQDIRIKYVKN